MKSQIDERLKALEAEFAAGQRMLAEIDARRSALTTTLHRIEGAMQVLKELGGTTEAAAPNGSVQPLRREG